MFLPGSEKRGFRVALLAEGVDRNGKVSEHFEAKEFVALLAEGVDRNSSSSFIAFACAVVALLAEGVDRNSQVVDCCCGDAASPSSRRAWIEIR